MDDLIDDLPFSRSGKTTFELIDHYLPILMGDLVNGKLKCGGKTGLKSTKPNIRIYESRFWITSPNFAKSRSITGLELEVLVSS